MSVFRRGGGWVSKFQQNGLQVWTPGGPWETKRRAQEAERRHRDRLLARVTDETCATFAERWLAEWPRPADSTRRNYRAAVERFSEHFGPTPLGEVERLSARTWALSVPRGVSRVIGIMYEDARNIGLVESNPFSNLRLPVQERSGKVLAPTLEEYRSLLAACTVLGGYAAEFRALIQFASWTGLRSGEIQALRHDDIGEDTITVRHSRQRDGALTPPKNGHVRTIAFLPPARVLDQVPQRPDDPYVFHSPRGGELRNGSLFYAWREVRSTSGIPIARADAGRRNIRFHDLRHFFAYRLKEQGQDPYTISLQLGHRDGGTLVIERYGMGGEEAANDRLLRWFEADERETGSWAGSKASAGGKSQA
jgi:integrase